MTVVETSDLKAEHDRLLEEKPEGAVHEAEGCPFCEQANEIEPEGGSVSETTEKTYTEAELKTAIDEAVASAVAEISSKLTELETKAVEETAKGELAEVQAKLDAAVLELEQVKNEKASVESFWADAIASHEEQIAAEARRDERLAAVREAASFPEEYLTANADRFAAMGDDEFAARIEEYKVIAAKSDATVPATTAMTAAAESTSRVSAVKALADFRKAGVDPRTIN